MKIKAITGQTFQTDDDVWHNTAPKRDLAVKLNGKAAMLSDLHNGDVVTLGLGRNGEQTVVVSISATRKKDADTPEPDSEHSTATGKHKEASKLTPGSFVEEKMTMPGDEPAKDTPHTHTHEGKPSSMPGKKGK